jgi:hypothetical protein
MITIDWKNRIIYIPKAYMSIVQTTPVEVRELNTNTFRLDLKSLEDSPEGMPYPDTHRHNAGVSVGGVELARVIEIINDYTITFEDGQYAVNLAQSNNNIADRVNVNQVSIRSANSAGLVQTREIEQASYNNQVAIDINSSNIGITYPVGTSRVPVNNFADALLIAAQRGLDAYYLKSNFTVGATDNVTALRFYGDGATLNVYRTTVTLTQGCVTTNSQWTHCRITGYQGGESLYHDCIIDGLENAHCIYERCGLVDGTSRGYTIKQTSSVSSGHASYFKECFSDEGTAVFDRNGAKLNATFDGFSGRIKFINQNHATSSGQIWIHLNGGTVTVDPSCTKGKITITGTGTLINQSAGTDVDASGFLSEGFEQNKLNLESLRQTHQGFGARWFVDPVYGNDLSPGNSSSSPLLTVSAATAKAVSGRGDVIFLIAPGAGVATINERIIIDKEDLHIRGPGRGVQFQPSTTAGGPVIEITANNCSLSGFIVRSPVGELTDDAIVISGKFSRLEKLYIVGPGQTGNTSRGVVFQAGDYHELYDMEIEKFGDSGLELDDQNTANGSPREISIYGGNFYLNGVHGICLHGRTGAALGTTSRIIRILRGANIHDNIEYGVHSDANVSGVVIDDSVLIHSNGAQVLLEGTGYYKGQDNIKQIWDYPITSFVVGSIGEFLSKKVLTVSKFLGLK